MARAGVQQISLPEIYKMFKTASDEDKIKLMNTYSNLGERLGKWDQDLEYRRLMGDPEALKQRTITEGVSDGLGGLWDYVKMGAGKVSDKVTDLFSTDEPTDEPVKEVPEVVRAQTTGMTLREDPFAQEETMSKEGFPVGQMSREAPTISPQEQVFLRGVGAPVEEEKAKEEKVVSPFDKRLNERLAKVAEQSARAQENPDLAWSSRYALDPKRTEFDYGRERDAMLYSLNEKKANAPKKEAPEKIIRMLQTEINRTTRNRDKAIEDFGANSTQAQGYNNLLKELEIEMTSESPSVKNAYTRSGKLPPPEASGLVGAEDIEDTIKNARFSDLGLLEGRDEIASAIEKWRVENGVSVQDPTYKSLIKTLEDKEKSKDKQYTRTDAEQKEFDKMEEKYKKLYTYSRNTPEATWAKSQLLNIVLRDETGAAIASDEARDLALNMLPDDATRNDFIYRWDTAISNAIANMDSAKDAVKIAAAASGNLPWSEVAGLGSLLEEIKGKMSGKKLQEYARSTIPTSYLKAKDRESKDKKPGPVLSIPAGKKSGDTWSDDDYDYFIDDNGKVLFRSKE